MPDNRLKTVFSRHALEGSSQFVCSSLLQEKPASVSKSLPKKIQQTPSWTVFWGIKKFACWTVFVPLTFALTACTGSSEQAVSGIELLVAVNPTQAPLTSGASCLDSATPQAVTGPGLLVLDTARLTNNSSTDGRCQFLALEAAPFSVLTGTRSPQGQRFVVSLPSVGKVQDWPSTLNGTPSVPTGPTELVRPTNAPDFCPTKLALSPTGDLAAAADSGITDAVCTAANRQTRVVVWRRFIAPGQPLQPSTPFAVDAGGRPIAIALSESTLFVFSQFSGQFKLTRYTLKTDTTPPTLDQETVKFPILSFPIAPEIGGIPKTANLLLSGSTLFIAYGDDFSGRVYQVAADAQAAPTDEFRINNQLLGNVLNLFTDGKVQDSANQPAFAFTLQNTIKFSRGDAISSLSATVQAVTFTPDGFAWTLGTGGNLTQYDLISVTNLAAAANVFLNSGLNARDLAWIQRPTP
jgi:hypothetical protein